MSTQRFLRSIARLLLASGLLCILVGCETLGPKSIRAGMPQYNMAITDTNSRLALLNFVRVRYSESPYFLEVSNIYAAPTFTASAGVSGSVGGVSGDSGLGSVGLEYSEAPVIIYTPVGGEQFVRRMLRPVGLENIGLLHQGGWHLQRVLQLFVLRINNIWNAHTATGPTPITPAPDFETFKRVAETLYALDVNGHAWLITEARVEEFKDDEDVAGARRTIIEFVIDPAVKGRPEVQQLFRDLELDPKAESYFLTDARFVKKGRTITIVTRPLVATMAYMSKGIRVPQRDQERGLVHVTLDQSGNPFDWDELIGDLFTIESSESAPENAYIAVQHHGTWFYIRNDDVVSKDTFTLFQTMWALRAGELPEGDTQTSIGIN